MFNSFRTRITRGYVLLAVSIIVVVVAVSSALAFYLFSRALGDAIAGAAQRASSSAAQILQGGTPLQQAAPKIVTAIGSSRFHVIVLDDRGRILAQSARKRHADAGAVAESLARLIGPPFERVTIPGGTIVISADVDRFGQLLLWYWSIMLPLGILAALAAWLFGRRITANAIGPLVDVSRSLRVIAGGDFSPQPLLEGSSDLRELTNAYNDVAYRLATATAERERTEAQMRQFIADAGHELRTPLTIVMGYLDALRQGIVQGPDPTRRTYETMLDESRKMRSLIEKLILLARLDRAPAAPLATVDLNAVVRSAAASIEPLAQGRLHVETVNAPTLVTANEAELHEAVKNVIDNAIKYAPESPITIRVRQDGAAACVSVADEGPGMEPQDAAHAFDRFYRGSTRGETEGSGLGLAIAKLAVERAGGTAHIQSELQKGTTVVLCLRKAR
jgi:signal transduction histidine kinase